jgi:mycoredoxin
MIACVGYRSSGRCVLSPGRGADGQLAFDSVLRSWWLAGVMLACGVLVAVAQDRPWLATTALLIFAGLAFLLSPLLFPRSLGAAQAQQRSARDGRPIVYWRPGCQYCLRLRLRLGRSASRAYWVNIWRDPAGAAVVRAVTGGDETVPTVTANGESVANPEPGWLRQQLER